MARARTIKQATEDEAREAFLRGMVVMMLDESQGLPSAVAADSIVYADQPSVDEWDNQTDWMSRHYEIVSPVYFIVNGGR